MSRRGDRWDNAVAESVFATLKVETAGLEPWLAAVQEALGTGTYRSQPVRRVLIPKPGGGERPLGIPVIRDRVVQAAALLIL